MLTVNVSAFRSFVLDFRRCYTAFWRYYPKFFYLFYFLLNKQVCNFEIFIFLFILNETIINIYFFYFLGFEGFFWLLEREFMQDFEGIYFEILFLFSLKKHFI